MSAEQEQLKIDLEGEAKKPEKVELPEVPMSTGKDDEIKVEVIDDTPPEDRGRKPLPKEVVDDLERDDLEEYSEKVKKRISQTKKAWHDERRAKEAALREREQALVFAQRAFQENQALRQRLGTGEQIFATEMAKAAQTEEIAAKESLKRAYDEGDSEKIAAAQEKLLEAKLRIRDVQSFRPSLQDAGEVVQTTPQAQPPRVVVDQKASAWRDDNPWFGRDKGMTAFALGLHEELVDNGIDPSSDDYYTKINTAMRKRFPEEFEDADDNAGRTAERQTPRKTTATVVAPASRSTAPRQVRLTTSELALAKKFGLTPEQYAREKIKLEMNNG